MNNQLYKPSNKAPVAGLIALFIGMTVAGVAVYWLYELLEGWIPLIYLNILLAFGASMLLGFIGGKMVKSFKMRAPFIVLIIACVAMLIASFARIAIYVARDWDKQYDVLKDYNFGEILASVPDSEIDAWSEDSAEVKALYAMLATIDDNSEDEKKFVKNLFGDSVETFKANIKRIKNEKMTYYEVMFDVCKVEKRTAVWLMTHPGEMFSDLKDINEYGRWTIKSSRHSFSSTSTTENNNVKGFMLWIVWFFELLILVGPAVYMTFDKAKQPFIESEDDWAVEEKPMPEFKFLPPDAVGRSASAVVKAEVLRDANYLFTLKAIPIIAPTPDEYIKVTYVRSRYFDENYITVTDSLLTNARKNQRRNTVLVKDLSVNADFIATLYGTFECTVPALCKGENMAKAMSAANEERKKAMESGRPLSPTPPKATGAEAIFDEPSIFSKQKAQPKTDDFAQKQYEEEQKQAQAAKPSTSGDMDGIDTSALDLDKIDLTRM